MFCFDIQATFGYSFFLTNVQLTPAPDTTVLISEPVSMGTLST